MTLIVGLKAEQCVVIGAEQEEIRGIIAKRSVTKLRLITGNDWAVVIGGAGDAGIAENAMRDMERKLSQTQSLNEQVLMDLTDGILDEMHTKYIDKDPKSEGLSLIIGASCGDELHLISTLKRVPQSQDSIAYAGIGADIGLYFMDRLHRDDADWRYLASVTGFTIQQAIESCQYCGGDPEVYILQRHPDPRWRSLGTYDAASEFVNSFQGIVGHHLEQLIREHLPDWFTFEKLRGYSDEYHPKARDEEDEERERQTKEKSTGS